MLIPEIRLLFTIAAATLGGSFFLYKILPRMRRWAGRIRSTRALKNARLSFAGTVTQLNIYPVKSFPGISQSAIHCGELGVSTSVSSSLIDRGFLLVFGNENRLVRITHEPTLSLIKLSFSETLGLVTFSAPSAAPLTFSPPTRLCSPEQKVNTNIFGVFSEGIDCGDEVAKWLSDYLRKPGHRLIYRAPMALKAKTRDLADTLPHSDIDGKNLKYRHIAYQNDSPVLVTNASSLTVLNSRLEEKITMRRFRPNIVIEGPAAWEEDEWELIVFCSKDVDPNVDRDGRQVILRRVGPCMRCNATTVNPDSGVLHPDKEPLATLKSFRSLESTIGKFESLVNLRREPVFGNCMGVVVEGEVREGDAVWVVKGKWNCKE